MKKNLKTILLSASLLISVKTMYSQCVGYTNIYPPINQVAGITSQIGGYNLPNVNGFFNKKVVGDFNGDGLDDIFMISDQPSGSNTSSGTFARLFVSNGSGGFNLSWTSAPNQLNLTSGSIPIVNGGFNLVAGNFFGDNKDEILIYNQLVGGSESTSWFLLGDLNNPTPSNLGTRSYGNPFSTGIPPIIGGAPINSRFYAANLIGDGHDELFSLNSGTNFWTIQTFNVISKSSSNFYANYSGSTSIGGWLLQANVIDDIYFANFDLTTSYDEIFILRKAGSWAMMQNFNTTTNAFTVRWTDYGNSDFFQNNQCAPYNYNMQFNASHELFFGNFDNCDADVECFIIANKDLAQVATLEFNSATNAFRCWSVKWPTLNNSNNIGGTTSVFAYSAYERWTSRRYCSSTCLGICCGYTGGQSYIQQRDFYSTNTKEGNLSFLFGNFYNNNYWNGFTYPTMDLMVFRNDIGSYPPSQLNGLTFLTNCSSDGLYGNYCPDNSNINIYNLSAQYIASFNRNNGLFNTTAVKSGRYCMYSLTDVTTNLRSNNNNDSIPKTNTFYKPTLIETNDIENISLFTLNVNPNPTSNKISVSFNSGVNLINNTVEIINVEGKVVYQTTTNIFEGINILDISVSNLKDGVYFVRYITTNGENYKSKFIKN